MHFYHNSARGKLNAVAICNISFQFNPHAQFRAVLFNCDLFGCIRRAMNNLSASTNCNL